MSSQKYKWTESRKTLATTKDNEKTGEDDDCHDWIEDMMEVSPCLSKMKVFQIAIVKR